jgi:hypothetical protein
MSVKSRHPRHGEGGVYYGGEWCALPCVPYSQGGVAAKTVVAPRSRSVAQLESEDYDVVIVGAGCIGGAIARELAKYDLKVLFSLDLTRKGDNDALCAAFGGTYSFPLNPDFF